MFKIILVFLGMWLLITLGLNTALNSTNRDKIKFIKIAMYGGLSASIATAILTLIVLIF